MTQTKRLQGKRALITAAGQGIGLASAIAMAREGAKVYATDVNKKALADLQSRGYPNISTLELDATCDASVKSGVEKADPDILFNCAGFVHHGSILDCTDEQWEYAFDLNVRSVFRTIRAALPNMQKRKYGSIINMSSAVSSVIGAPDRFIYGTTKAAVIGTPPAPARSASPVPGTESRRRSVAESVRDRDADTRLGIGRVYG